MGKGKHKNKHRGMIVVASIKIQRVLTEDGDTIWMEAKDEAGEELSLMDGLGMLRLAEDTLIHQRMDFAGTEIEVVDDDDGTG